ncbi:hypothetical protein M8C21_033860 [Ambrosia artemisiifolia]|uniref:Legume lectin domain-containing protein n=1 Tax=Ambrosia artemisiifolia TaxID=4212 RepID=A0AAD5GFT1_AMBAR|nr:hypothetical protein M8C21_033860 [Ambrosia artemisiifolia]
MYDVDIGRRRLLLSDKLGVTVSVGDVESKEINLATGFKFIWVRYFFRGFLSKYLLIEFLFLVIRVMFMSVLAGQATDFEVEQPDIRNGRKDQRREDGESEALTIYITMGQLEIFSTLKLIHLKWPMNRYTRKSHASWSHVKATDSHRPLTPPLGVEQRKKPQSIDASLRRLCGFNLLASNLYVSLPWVKATRMRTEQNIHAWIDFDGPRFEINVTIAPVGVSRSVRPLISFRNLIIRNYLSSEMFVGFSAAKTTWVEAQRVLAWSFSDTGVATTRDPAGLTSQNNELKFRLQAMEQQA